MSEWWTYRPSDFLLFSPRVYGRLIESHNAGLWPWQIAALMLGLAILWLALRRRTADGRIALGAAGLAMAWVGWSFLWSRYAGINWAAGYAAPAFALQGAAMLAVAAASRGPLREARDLPGMLAAGLVALAVAAYPLAGPLSGRSWSAAEVVGVMADPTALLALGLAALVRAPAALALAPVPLIWSVYACVTLATLGAAEAWLAGLGLALFAAASTARFVRPAASP